MSGPSTTRGWLAWSCYVREYQGRSHSPRLEYEGFSDRRMHDSRESAISVLTLAEKASHAVCGNGVGYKLLMDYYAGEASWWSFSEPEQRILAKTARAFAKMLRREGFLVDL